LLGYENFSFGRKPFQGLDRLRDRKVEKGMPEIGRCVTIIKKRMTQIGSKRSCEYSMG